MASLKQASPSLPLRPGLPYFLQTMGGAEGCPHRYLAFQSGCGRAVSVSNRLVDASPAHQLKLSSGGEDGAFYVERHHHRDSCEYKYLSAPPSCDSGGVDTYNYNGPNQLWRFRRWENSPDTYTIELLVSKLLKYMMSENEIQPLEFKAAQAGEHFVGRRVQVPFVGAESKDEVMGEVRAYDEATGTYTVAMDNGITKRNLVSEQIKVRPERKKKS